MSKTHLVVGIMSGTSLDGIDAVLLDIRGNGTATRFTQRAHVSSAFPRGAKEMLLKNSNPFTSRVDDIARLNFLLAELYADAVAAVAKRGRVKMSQIDLIGSHGQTVQHLPAPHKLFGKTIRATLQIGDPSVLATLTGVTTVGDFRVADMAAGGQGAPLVPYFDWLAFRSRTRNRILLNIGGIANMTVLPKGCLADDVVAFDTGPGNMVVDALMQHLYGRSFDRNGKTASRGMIALELFHWLAAHPYVQKKPPKSTGREEFGKTFVARLRQRARYHDREDIIATASQFTAYAVHGAYTKFVRSHMHADEVIVSGGGARNSYVMQALQDYFRGSRVTVIDEFGVSSEAKEAICFAVLANETMAGHATNIPCVTGATRKVVMGKVCVPHRPGRA